jgi:hypothetical protein
MMADNLVRTAEDLANWQVQINWAYATDEDDLEVAWVAAYSVVNQANLVLRNIDRFAAAEPTRVNRIKGQALAIRAYAHFDVLRYWAKVTTAIHGQGHSLLGNRRLQQQARPAHGGRNVEQNFCRHGAGRDAAGRRRPGGEREQFPRRHRPTGRTGAAGPHAPVRQETTPRPKLRYAGYRRTAAGHCCRVSPASGRTPPMPK